VLDHDPPQLGGVRALLADEPDFLVIGEAADGEDAVRLVAELAPDVVVMDIHMPRMDGIEATRRISRGEHAPKVLAFSVADAATAARIIAAGAAAFVSKTDEPEQLVDAIRAVLDRHRTAVPDGYA
jgi:DNA-binding NarL/FixJ family response regulator